MIGAHLPLMRTLALALCLAVAASAQLPHTLFASYFGGRDLEYGNAVAVGPGGDIWSA